MKRALILSGTTWLATLILAATAKATPPASPEQSSISNLSSEVTMADFSIRPPKGYTLVEQSGPDGIKAHAWRGATRPDTTSPYVMVEVIKFPVGETNMPPLSVVLAKFLSGIERRRENWQQGPAQQGMISGLSILRSHWSGTEPTSNWKMHGFVWVAVTNRCIFEISSQDVEPHSEQALKLAEASTLTFKTRE